MPPNGRDATGLPASTPLWDKGVLRGTDVFLCGANLLVKLSSLDRGPASGAEGLDHNAFFDAAKRQSDLVAEADSLGRSVHWPAIQPDGSRGNGSLGLRTALEEATEPKPLIDPQSGTPRRLGVRFHQHIPLVGDRRKRAPADPQSQGLSDWRASQNACATTTSDARPHNMKPSPD